MTNGEKQASATQEPPTQDPSTQVSPMQARVWQTAGPETFPEHRLGVVARPDTGICISGGGTRSLSAGLGQLRGLARLGLLEQVGYCSTVSGGAICGTGYTFARDPVGDAELMGQSCNPEDLTWDQLLGEPPALGRIATGDLVNALWRMVEGDVPRDEIWIRAIGEVYLRPLGLDGEGAPPHYGLDAEQLAPLLERNPWLQLSDFALVREASAPGFARPFLLVNSTLMWPVGDLRKTNLVGCQTTPLYFGSAAAVPLQDDDLENIVGGGFIAACAAGCVAPGRRLSPPPDGEMQWVDVTGPCKPYTLTDATATSGASFARQLAPIDPDFAPEMTYWPVLPDTDLVSAVYDFGDGGNIENYGLISLLLRGVEKIVVFINTSEGAAQHEQNVRLCSSAVTFRGRRRASSVVRCAAPSLVRYRESVSPRPGLRGGGFRPRRGCPAGGEADRHGRRRADHARDGRQ